VLSLGRRVPLQSSPGLLTLILPIIILTGEIMALIADIRFGNILSGPIPYLALNFLLSGKILRTLLLMPILFNIHKMDLHYLI
jgi:hypothetical protein